MAVWKTRGSSTDCEIVYGLWFRVYRVCGLGFREDMWKISKASDGDIGFRLCDIRIRGALKGM